MLIVSGSSWTGELTDIAILALANTVWCSVVYACLIARA